MTTAHDPVAGMLPRAKSTHLVGPISGAQLGALLAALVLPVVLLTVAGPRATVLLVSVWTGCAITAYRRAGQNGWWWIAFAAHAASRQGASGTFTVTATDIEQPPEPPPAAAKGARPVFSAAPGPLRGACAVEIPGYGPAFAVPPRAKARKTLRVTTGWIADADAYDTAPTADANAAVARWAAALDGIARLDGIAAVWLHVDTQPASVPDAASVPDSRAGNEYRALLAELGAQPAARVAVSITWNTRDHAARGVGDTVRVLTAAGIDPHTPITPDAVVQRLLDAPLLSGATPLGVGQRPAIPAYRETTQGLMWSDTGHATAALMASSALPVMARADVLAPLLAAPAQGTRLRTAVLLRPARKAEVQAQGRARRAKLRRSVAAADSSLWSSMLVDSHSAEAELEALEELAARGARGQSEYQAIVMATITAADPAAVSAAARVVVREALPLLFAPVAHPFPVIAAVSAPTGVLA